MIDVVILQCKSSIDGHTIVMFRLQTGWTGSMIDVVILHCKSSAGPYH